VRVWWGNARGGEKVEGGLRDGKRVPGKTRRVEFDRLNYARVVRREKLFQQHPTTACARRALKQKCTPAAGNTRLLRNLLDPAV
jgi:hypothetical protein